MAVELNKLLSTADAEVKGSVSRDLAGFRQLFDKFVTKSGVSVDWDKIEKLPTQSVRFTGQNRKYSFCIISQIIHHSELRKCSNLQRDQIKQMLDKLVVIKLNGALATPLGCR